MEFHPIQSVARRRPAALLGAAAALLLPASAVAQNAAFQNFFTSVCAGSPTGALAARCGETPGGGGNVSGDSEVSLNPDQALFLNDAALARARVTAKEVQERLEQQRDADPDAGDTAARWSLLLNGRWEGFEHEGTSRQRGLEGDKWSGQVGADVRLSERAVVGGLFTYDRTDTEIDRQVPAGVFTAPGDSGETESDSYSITAFGSYNLTDPAWVDAHVGFGYTHYDFTRRASFQESTRTLPQTNVNATGESDGFEVSAGAGIGYDADVGGLSTGVYARGNFVWSQVDGYRERDASGLQMRIGGEDQTSLVSILGLRGGHAVSTAWGVLLPQVRIEYEHEFLRDAQTFDARYRLDGSGNVYTLRSDTPDRNHGNAGAGILMVLPNGWMPFVDWEMLFGHEFADRQRVTFGVRKEL